MATDDDDRYAAEVIRTVAELTKRTEALSQQVAQSVVHADEERKTMIGSVDATVAAMRQDFWRTTIAIQRDATIHRDEHIVERKERAADIVQRTQRQAIVDTWMWALTILAAINLLALLGIAILIVTQAYGR